MSLGSSLIDGDFVDCGINKVKIDVVCKKWDERFFITSWHDSDFRLIATRKKGKMYILKLTISKEQAFEIINNLKLECMPSYTLKKAKTYRRGDLAF